MKNLSKMSDAELKNNIKAMKDFVARLQNQNEDSVEAEKNLCYFEREKEIREDRWRSNQKYLEETRTLEEEYQQMFLEAQREEEEAIKEYMMQDFRAQERNNENYNHYNNYHARR